MFPASRCAGSAIPPSCSFVRRARRPSMWERMMRHAVSREIYAYWRALGTGGCAPERNTVEPGAIRSVLADTFVLDFDPADGFPFRICGSRVNAVFLKELRGAP